MYSVLRCECLSCLSIASGKTGQRGRSPKTPSTRNEFPPENCHFGGSWKASGRTRSENGGLRCSGTALSEMTTLNSSGTMLQRHVLETRWVCCKNQRRIFTNVIERKDLKLNLPDSRLLDSARLRFGEPEPEPAEDVYTAQDDVPAGPDCPVGRPPGR